MSTSLLVQLAQKITQNVTKLDQYHDEQRLPKPSFDVDAPSTTSYPDDIEACRDSILSATTELQQLVLGPVDAIKDLVENHNSLVSVHAIHKYDIARSFPINGTARFKDVAAVSGMSEQATKRILRHGMMHRIFAENEDGTIKHTAMSQLLAEDELLRDIVGMMLDDLWKSATRVTDALQSWPTSTEMAQTAYSLSHNTGVPYYAELAKNPEKSRRFANSLRGFDPETMWLFRQVAAEYPWDKLGSGLVVDMNGFQGETSVFLAQQFPNLKFQVQDVPGFLNARGPWTHPELDDRIEFRVQDMFGPQQCKGADVYYMRWTLHSWPDLHCVGMLQNFIPALKKGARILLHSWVAPKFKSTWKNRRMLQMDIAQLELQNNRERTIDQWRHLFTLASPHYDFRGVVSSHGHMDFIEAVWNGD